MSTQRAVVSDVLWTGSLLLEPVIPCYPRPMRILKISLVSLGVLIGIAIIGWIALVVIISRIAAPNTYYSVDSVPSESVAVVFGALVTPAGQLSPILKDRVDGGIALYKAGKVSHLLMTGDNSTVHYNEVAAMQTYALSQGVPQSAITLDYAGFDTHDSCYRAQAIFGVTKAILVTQKYHMPRAMYLCRSLGIHATGYALDDFNKYPDLRVSYTAREYVADIKAWWQIFTHAKPKFLGPQELIK